MHAKGTDRQEIGRSSRTRALFLNFEMQRFCRPPLNMVSTFLCLAVAKVPLVTFASKGGDHSRILSRDIPCPCACATRSLLSALHLRRAPMGPPPLLSPKAETQGTTSWLAINPCPTLAAKNLRTSWTETLLGSIPLKTLDRGGSSLRAGGPPAASSARTLPSPSTRS